VEPLTHATFEASDGQIIPLRSVHVEGDYVGLLSITTITQTYQNPIDQALEVTYTFPLVTGATLLDVTIQIRGNTFKSEAFPIHIGKQRYSEATKTGDTAIIIERSGPFYALQLGNLPGGEEVKITYRYGQFVMPHDGHVRVTVPTTIAPQYGNPQDSGIAPNRAPFTNMDATYPFSAVFRFHGIAQSRIYVVSHIAQITMHGNDCHVAINGATMDRDVVVHVKPTVVCTYHMQDSTGMQVTYIYPQHNSRTLLRCISSYSSIARDPWVGVRFAKHSRRLCAYSGYYAMATRFQ